MIELVSVKKNPDTGIYHINVKTENKWVDYFIQGGVNMGELKFSYFINHEEFIKTIYVDSSFDSAEYCIYTSQCKDQIAIICIPRDFIINEEKWKCL